MPLVITGATGRVGRALRAAWHGAAQPQHRVLWSARSPGQGIDLVWDIGLMPAPRLPHGANILHLAAIIAPATAALAENRRMADAICRAALDCHARHVFLMSSAAVYRPGPQLCHETDDPAPVNAYGQAKLDAERVAQALLPQGAGPGLTLLRLGNLAGADALLGRCLPDKAVTLDPIAGQSRGPERSYIGPAALASVLAGLIDCVAKGQIPGILNIAQPPVVAMADLLDAKGQPWHFGPKNPAAVARVGLATDRLAALVPLHPATPAALIADLDQFRGRWP